MKKTKKTALTAALFAAAMQFTACGTAPAYHPESDIPQDVYGPPREEIVSQTEPVSSTEISSQPVITEERAEEEVQNMQCVYGPPPERN